MSRLHSERMSGGKRQARTRRLLAINDVCHICGHPDSDCMDHVVSLKRGGSDDESNLQPAHQQPCPTCGEPCNLRKGTKAWAPVIRRSSSLDRP